MNDERAPLALELTPDAKKEGIRRMHAHLRRTSGRERTHEDARAAFENLLGFYTTVCDWKARADLEDQARAATEAVPTTPSPPPNRRKTKTKGQKATTAE